MNRIAVVTGGIGGLGTAICKDLIDQGRHVVSTYRAVNFEKAQKWQQARKEEGYGIGGALLFNKFSKPTVLYNFSKFMSTPKACVFAF